MLLAGSTRFLSLGVSRSGRREAAAPAHAMAPTRTVCIRQSCLAFPRRCSKLCWVRTRAAQEPGEPPPREGWRARARAEHRRPKPARHYARTHPQHPHTSSSPPDPSAQFPVALFGHFPRRAAAKAGRAGVPPPASYGGREAPRARPCPASSPLVARLVSSLGQARTRARPGHRARPLLNVWLPTHSFPQRVAARTYSTSPAQAHALVGCTASHRPWHTNERPRAQAVRTSRAKPGAHASASGYRFPAAARKARPQGHAPTQSNTGSVTTPTAQAR